MPLFLLMGLLLAGLTGKALRYFSDAPSKAVRAESAVAAFLAEDGWLPTRRTPLTAGATYSMQLYAKAECGEAMAVAVLGVGEEMTTLLTRRFAGDFAYLVGGRLTDQPPTLDFLIRSLAAGLWLRSEQVLPILVVAPKPLEETESLSQFQECAPPSVRRWGECGQLPWTESAQA